MLRIVYSYIKIDNKKLSYIRSVIYWAANCMSTSQTLVDDSLFLDYFLEGRKQAQQVYSLGSQHVGEEASNRMIDKEHWSGIRQKYIINKQNDDIDTLTTIYLYSHTSSMLATSSSSSLRILET